MELTFYSFVLILLCVAIVVSSIYIHIHTHFTVKKNMANGLAGEVEKTRRMICDGVPYEQLDLRPIEELSHSGVTDVEILFYNQFYVCSNLALGNMHEVAKATEEMRNIVEKTEFFVKSYVNAYYWLVTYYSYFEPKEYYAKRYMERVKSFLKKDPDANAKRVFAYYHYAVKDYATARTYVNMALDSVDNFSRYAEQDQEKQLLHMLDEELTNRGY